MRIEFKFLVSVLQSRCHLEIFGNVLVASRNFFFFFLGKTDIMVLMATLFSHCYKRKKISHGEKEIVLIKPVIDHF